MKLEDYQKPNNIPGWLEKVLYNQQQKAIPFFDRHAETIKSFYEEQDCKTFIDLGCWLGAFSWKIKKVINPQTLTLIDACPTYLWMAKNLLLEHNLNNSVHLLEMTICDHDITHFVVDLDRTIHTSSTIQTLNDGVISCNMPVVKPTSYEEAAKKLFHLAGNNCYMKMDIDGNDYKLIKAMLDINFVPRVLHFEAWLRHDFQKEECLNILKRLYNLGYMIPPMYEIVNNIFADIIVSRHKSITIQP